MEPLNLQEFAKKVQQPKVEVNQNRETQTNTSTTRHRDIVLNNVQMLMKWAYDN